METKIINIWKNILIELKNTLEEETFNDLFKNNTKLREFSNNNVYITVNDDFTKNRIYTLFISHINKYAEKYSDEKLNFIFETEDDIKSNEELVKPTIVDKNSYYLTNLLPEFRFNNFVVGQSNIFAFQMAMKVAEQPAVVSNPFYIFGDVGLGKTHLMQAIGNYFIEKNTNAKVLYVKADMFVEEFSNNMHSLDKSIKMQEFTKKYRDVDLLLVDDIQLLSGAEKTQYEFFKIFDFLNNHKKQIVITSDKPADKLSNIMSRLTTRFTWGLIANISNPNLDHRMDILKKKLSLSFDSKTVDKISDDSLKFIAENFTSNVRSLEGALRTAVNYCLTLDKPLDIENFKIALQPMINSNNVISSRENTSYNIKKLLSIVCDYYSILEKDLVSSKRHYSIVVPRHIAMYLIKYLFDDLSYLKIAQIFNRKDHSTVLNAYNKIAQDLETDEVLKKAISDILNKYGDK